MSNDVRYTYGGPGFWGWLTILFIGLKLPGFINWSWWLVLAPIWVGLALFGIIAFIGLVVLFFASR
jgi:hypothetical protein